MPSLDIAVTRLNPLCVDLDGCLVKCDTLHDLMLTFIKQQPGKLLRLAGWVMGGKASLKEKLSQAVTLDVQSLPYNKPLVEFLRRSRKAGRQVYLVTGADQAVAQHVADYLGLFSGVLSSDGKTNRVGGKKLRALREKFGDVGFDYVGNSLADLEILQSAGQAMVANPHRVLSLALWKKRVRIASEFVDRPGYFKSLVRAIRLHQWVKNAIVFLPLLLSHELTQGKLVQATVAFFCFSPERLSHLYC